MHVMVDTNSLLSATLCSDEQFSKLVKTEMEVLQILSDIKTSLSFCFFGFTRPISVISLRSGLIILDNILQQTHSTC